MKSRFTREKILGICFWQKGHGAAFGPEQRGGMGFSCRLPHPRTVPPKLAPNILVRFQYRPENFVEKRGRLQCVFSQAY